MTSASVPPNRDSSPKRCLSPRASFAVGPVPVDPASPASPAKKFQLKSKSGTEKTQSSEPARESGSGSNNESSMRTAVARSGQADPDFTDTSVSSKNIRQSDGKINLDRKIKIDAAVASAVLTSDLTGVAASSSQAASPAVVGSFATPTAKKFTITRSAAQVLQAQNSIKLSSKSGPGAHRPSIANLIQSTYKTQESQLKPEVIVPGHQKTEISSKVILRHGTHKQEETPASAPLPLPERSSPLLERQVQASPGGARALQLRGGVKRNVLASATPIQLDGSDSDNKNMTSGNGNDKESLSLDGDKLSLSHGVGVGLGGRKLVIGKKSAVDPVIAPR